MGPNAAMKIQKIRRKASEGKWMAGVYYITLTGTSGNLLDIFHNALLKQPLFAENQCMDIVGVAEGREEAWELAAQIVGDVYTRLGSFDMPLFFQEEDFYPDESYGE